MAFLISSDIVSRDVFILPDDRTYANNLAGIPIFNVYMQSGTKLSSAREKSFQNLAVNLQCFNNKNMVLLLYMNSVYER